MSKGETGTPHEATPLGEPRKVGPTGASVLWREAATVGAVLGLFGFCAMYFVFGERLEKSLIIGLAGGAVGSFRFVTRAVRGKR